MNQPQLHLLPNGLRLMLVPCEAESVAVGVFVNSGSRDESAKTAGISHFIEHMLFKGTPSRSALDITLAIEGRGGNFNACTSEEATCYYAHLPSEYLGEAVDILADMYLNASFAADEFAREKQVVIEEIRMYADEPDSVAGENLQRNIFPKAQLGAPVAGTPESLAPLTPADMHAYVKRHYRADNTVLVVVGAFDSAAAIALVGKAFAALKKPRSPLVRTPFAPSPVVPEKTVTRDVAQAQLALGYRMFGIDHPLKYAVTTLDAILGRGMSSRLFQEVREKRGLSYDIASRAQFFGDTGMFAITAGLDPAKADKALATIDRELNRVTQKKVGAAELKRMKEFLIGNFRLSHEKVTSKMFFYGQTLLSFGRLVTPAEQVEGIRDVTADDVLEAARLVFRRENRSLSWVLPKANAALGAVNP